MTSLPSTPSSIPHSTWIALGGNLGDVASTIARALQLLEQTPGIEILKSSPLHRTAPVGNTAGSSFTNAVAQLLTTLDPLALLDRCQKIETELGRTRTLRWGPRTLDLDLLLYGDEAIDHPRLQVPHPACWYRRFVLDPWVEVGADVVHPVKRLTIGELHARLLVRPLSLLLAGGDRELREQLLDSLKKEFSSVQWSAISQLSERQPTITIGMGPGDMDVEEYERVREKFAVSWLELRTSATTELEAIREIVHSAMGE